MSIKATATFEVSCNRANCTASIEYSQQTQTWTSVCEALTFVPPLILPGGWIALPGERVSRTGHVLPDDAVAMHLCPRCAKHAKHAKQQRPTTTTKSEDDQMGHTPMPVKPLSPADVREQHRKRYQRDLERVIAALNEDLVKEPPTTNRGKRYSWKCKILKEVGHQMNRDQLIKLFRDVGWDVGEWSDQKERDSGIEFKYRTANIQGKD